MKGILRELITEDSVQFDVVAKDRNQAISLAGEILVKQKKVDSSYIPAMIENCEKFGPYIVLAPGLAIPHAAPNAGIKELGISCVILNEPVVFGNEENDPVKLVICIASPDNKSHLELLSELSAIIMDPQRLNQLECVQTKQEFLQLIYTLSK